MKNSLKILCSFSIMFSVFFLSSSAFSSLFQNSDQECETHLVPCNSTSCPASVFGTNQASTIACHNINDASVDFNQDSAPDCILGRSGFDDNISISYLLGNPGSTGCGNVFSGAEDHSLSSLPDPVSTGSIVAGNIGGTDAFFYPSITTSFEYGLLVSGGVGTDESLITVSAPNTPSWDASSGGNYQVGIGSVASDRNTVVLDCNNDGINDIGLLVNDTEVLGPSLTQTSIHLNILLGNGSLILPINASTGTFQVTAPSLITNKAASLAVADFNNDELQDVAVAVNDAATSTVVICANTGTAGAGSCSFTCASPIDLTQGGVNPRPFSIATGDFDGDENSDIVISEPNLTASGMHGIRFFFGNGTGSFSASQSLSADYSRIVGTSSFPQSISTGCFNNDNAQDVVVAYDLGSYGEGGARADVFTFDASQTLTTTPLFFTGTNSRVASLDTADFDAQGGDDIVVIASDFVAGRQAYIFMNTLEELSADAGANQALTLGDAATFSGVCAFSPSDPEDQIEYTWTVTSRPGGSTEALTGSDTATPQFTPDVEGSYVLQLQCRSRCTSFATDTLSLTVEPVVGPGPSGPGTAPALPPGLTTQGGCVSSLQPGATPADFSLVSFVLLQVGIWLGWRLRKVD